MMRETTIRGEPDVMKKVRMFGPAGMAINYGIAREDLTFAAGKGIAQGSTVRMSARWTSPAGPRSARAGPYDPHSNPNPSPNPNPNPNPNPSPSPSPSPNP